MDDITVETKEGIDRNVLGQKIQAQGDKAQQIIDDINSGKNQLSPDEIKQVLLDMLTMINVAIKG